MRASLLIASTLAGIAAMGAPAQQPTVIKQRLHAVERPTEERRGAMMTRQAAAMAAQKAPGRFELGDVQPFRAGKNAPAQKTHRLDEIIITQNGEVTARQRFEYFDNGLSHLRINEFKTPDGWDPVEEYGYTWDDDGYCLQQWGRSYDGMSGMMNEFTYNDR